MRVGLNCAIIMGSAGNAVVSSPQSLGGEIGRHAGLKIPCLISVTVRVRPEAPDSRISLVGRPQKAPHLICFLPAL
jgi:hypothetical protein